MTHLGVDKYLLWYVHLSLYFSVLFLVRLVYQEDLSCGGCGETTWRG